MTEPAISSLAATGGGSAVAGGVTGYLAKKIVKLIVFIVGAFVAAIAYLEREGIIGSVDWVALNAAIMDALSGIEYGKLAAHAGVTGTVFGASFLGGFKAG